MRRRTIIKYHHQTFFDLFPFCFPDQLFARPIHRVQSRGRDEIGGVYLPSNGAHTSSLYVMVTRVKGGGRAPPNLPSRADFSIMMEYMPKIGNCHSVCTLWSNLAESAAFIQNSLNSVLEFSNSKKTCCILGGQESKIHAQLLGFQQTAELYCTRPNQRVLNDLQRTRLPRPRMIWLLPPPPGSKFPSLPVCDGLAY